MDRRPLWPIAVGVIGWVSVGVAAYNEIWWPLYVAIPMSVLPGLGALLVWRGARRIKRTAPEIAQAQADAAPREVVEPPRASKGGARTNAKTAGRRRRGEAGAVAWMLAIGSAALASEGCKPEPAATGKAEPSSKAAEPTVVPGKAGDATAATAMSPEQRALAAVLVRAIQPPQGSDATYRVDPFVAALVYEQIRAGSGPSFTALAGPVAEGGPPAGFRVGEVADGSLLHELGLRSGDVVEAINAVMLTDASRVAFALDGAENRVALTIYRDDISLVQSYKLTQSLAWTELLTSQEGTAIAAADAPPVDDIPVPSSDEGIAVPDDGGAAEPSDDGGDAPASPGKRAPSSGGSTTPSGGGGKPLPSSGGGGTHPTPPKPSGADQVRCESAGRCTISRAYFEKMTSSPSAISSQASIVPAISNDVFSGYKLKTVKSGSNVAKLGFQSGDKITHINGKDLTDDIQAAQVYFALGSTKIFKIRYTRGGSSLLKTVTVE
jgi:membrane-associated protease RseP (regulator of RpoE activity)